ncbi:MAG: DUF134 domain-containing protein [Planctomycetota bacterium]
MARPVKCRTVCCNPRSDYFKPHGVPVRRLEEVSLTMDELEAVRLADLEGMYQEDAASRMNISRQTFGNIINSAHNKIADALLNAKSLRIKGGKCTLAETRRFECGDCNNVWQVAHGTERPQKCPQCRCIRIRRAEGDKDSIKKRVNCLRRKRYGRFQS